MTIYDYQCTESVKKLLNDTDVDVDADYDADADGNADGNADADADGKIEINAIPASVSV